MAITTEGGNGVVSGTETVTDDNNGAVNTGSVTIFTTPSTSNATFIVNIGGFAKLEDGNSTQTVDNLSVHIGGDQGNLDGFTSQQYGSDSQSETPLNTTFKVGPNTTIEFTYVAINGGSSSGQSPGFEYNISYSYLGAVVS
jgi:hypothetical protein